MIGHAARQQGDLVTARSAYEEILRLNQGSGSNADVADALLHLGQIAQAADDEEGARSCYQQSLVIWQALDEPAGLAATLERFAKLAERRQPERAARLLGAAAALRQTTGAVIDPADQCDYEADVKAVRSVLGEVVFEAAWREGQALPPEQVIASAMDGN